MHPEPWWLWSIKLAGIGTRSYCVFCVWFLRNRVFLLDILFYIYFSLYLQQCYLGFNILNHLDTLYNLSKSQWYQTSIKKKHINYFLDLEGHLRDLFGTISNIDCCLYTVIRPSLAFYTSQLIKVQQNKLWKLKKNYWYN